MEYARMAARDCVSPERRRRHVRWLVGGFAILRNMRLQYHPANAEAKAMVMFDKRRIKRRGTWTALFFDWPKKQAPAEFMLHEVLHLAHAKLSSMRRYSRRWARADEQLVADVCALIRRR